MRPPVRFLFWMLPAWLCLTAEAQERRGLLSRLAGDSTRPSRPHVIVYPTLGYAPETKVEFGIGAGMFFKMGRDVKDCRQSAVQGLAFYTLRKQVGAYIDHTVYTPHSHWFLGGRYRIQKYPLLYYGIGPETNRHHNYLVQANYLLLRERVLHRLGSNLYAGVSADFQRMWGIRFREPYNGDTVGVGRPAGAEGSTNFGLGGSLVYDTRQNYLNVRRGLYLELTSLRYAKGLGSDYQFTTLLADLRGYFRPFHPKQTLAMQLYAFSEGGGRAPFNQLALLGSEQLMRGYYMGRFRDNHYTAAQAEYRFLPFPFSRKVGGTIFGAVGSVAPRIRDIRLEQTKWAAGVGARYLIMPAKDVFVRLDVAFTHEQTGFYFFLGEAF